MHVIQASSGQVFSGGVEQRVVPVCIHSKDIVKFSLDYESHTLTMSINDESYGVVIYDLPNIPLSPCVYFYGIERYKILLNKCILTLYY